MYEVLGLGGGDFGFEWRKGKGEGEVGFGYQPKVMMVGFGHSDMEFWMRMRMGWDGMGGFILLLYGRYIDVHD